MVQAASRPLASAWVVACLVAFVSGRALAGDVIVHEIHYEPLDKLSAEEFIELFNRGDAPVDISGWFFSDGVDFTFPAGTVLAPGAYVVVGEDPETLADVYGVGDALGPWAGRLSNQGERIVLRNTEGRIEDEVDYAPRFPWPLSAEGQGSSMELIHPSLDNDLGFSWRSSGIEIDPDLERVYFLEAESEWRYRKALSEPSDPVDAWRLADFAEDGSWTTGQASIGFGDEDDNTILDDMEDNYTGIYLRKTIEVAEVPEALMISYYVDDGAVIWINGVEVYRTRGMTTESYAFDATADRSSEARWFDDFLPDPGRYLVPGENTIAVHAMNQRISSNDFSFDVQLFSPGREDFDDDFTVFPPSPGGANLTFTEAPPPQIRQVRHLPQQPTSGQRFLVTARVTDPDGVAGVDMLLQTVAPGDYIPAFLPHAHAQLLSRPDDPQVPNPAFHDAENWERIPMRDDGEEGDVVAGDGTYTAVVPGQESRTLVRYRIEARDAGGASIRAPLPDDASLNFAAWVYDGVPAYVASSVSVHPEGRGHVYDESVMNALPVYTIVTRQEDWTQCVAYSGSFQIPKSNEGARDKFNWECAFVYDGVVYDHATYRLRQANDRYGGTGKRSFRFRFPRGNLLAARDNYGELFPEKWRTINTGKMFDNKRVGNFGLTERMNHELWNMMSVPAPWVYTFHMRVVKTADEVPEGSQGQFTGDFHGMQIVFENYDPRFLRTHRLEDGNLYKLKDGIFNGADLLRSQGRFAVRPDADFQNIRRNLRPQRDEAWLDAHVNFSRWNPYHAVVEGIRHYDFVPADSHSKNRAWYFEPDYSGSEYGRMWVLPWDSDASWGPNWNSGIDYVKNAIFSGRKEGHLIAYRNTIREFRDLVWTEEVIHRMIDDLALRITDFAMADRDRWRSAPAQAGRQDFGPMETKVLDMKRFAFLGWTGSTGPSVPAGGRARHLENLANAGGDLASIPETPVVEALGAGDYPADALAFRASEFVDPQEDEFSAIRWRIAEITPPDDPWLPDARRKFEVPAEWEQEFGAEGFDVTIPESVVRPGRVYRVRAKVQDATGRFSHWSEPVEFVAGGFATTSDAQDGLRITEVMYHPVGDEDFEWIELRNVGGAPIDLADVRFEGGIEFSFAAGATDEGEEPGEAPPSSLGAGEYLVLAKNPRVFATRWDANGAQVAGPYRGNLANTGERIVLVEGASRSVLDFEFDDAWHPGTDGLGYSLVIDDDTVAVDLWSDPESWRESFRVGGSPGAPDLPVAEGLLFPGDVDASGDLGIGDPVALLRHLFLGDTVAPCGRDASEEATAAALDIDGDGSLAVTDPIQLLDYLFRRGLPPALGVECLTLPDCEGACAP